MAAHCPVQTSTVYVIGQNEYPAIPPPSPPSPVTPAEDVDICEPIEGLCLDEPASPSTEAQANNDRLAAAIHVLNTEANALRALTGLYAIDPVARDGFARAVDAIVTRQGRGGKLVAIGVGKSGHIAKKMVATFNSLGVQAQFLHPTEALHGDLGQLNPRDAVMLITFSGKTPELLLLLPHLDLRCPLVLLTSHIRPDACEIVRRRPDAVLLPAPVHEPEALSFGVSAPTTSTTAALAVGDALAIVSSQEIHKSVSAVFERNHPGGAIGAAFTKQAHSLQTASTTSLASMSTASSLDIACVLSTSSTKIVQQLSVPLASIPALPSPATATGGDILRAAYASPSGWLCLEDDGDGSAVLSPSRIRALSIADFALPLCELDWAITRRADFICVTGDTLVSQAVEWICRMREASDRTESETGDGAVVAVLEGGKCVGVLEVERLMKED